MDETFDEKLLKMEQRYYDKLEKQQAFYIKLMSGVVVGIGLLMTLMKFWR